MSPGRPSGNAPFHFGVLVAVLIVAAGAVFAGGAVFGDDVASGGTDPGGPLCRRLHLRDADTHNHPRATSAEGDACDQRHR